MAGRVRFHLDEQVPHAVASGLRARHIDVTTTADAELLGAADTAHIEFAQRECRVIFTNDTDFLPLASEGLTIITRVYARKYGSMREAVSLIP